MTIQAGEYGPGWHHLIGLIPAMSKAEPGGITLTFLVQDGIQPLAAKQGIVIKEE